MTLSKEDFLKSKGWSTWYNEKYWVNPKLVSDPRKQEYTNYGMDLESAYFHEINDLGKFEPTFLPEMSMIKKAIENKEKIKKHFKGKES